jgi:hypothetical protein
LVGREGGQHHQIVSEELLALLSDDERRGLELQPTNRKGRRKFHELVGPEGPPHVAVASIDAGGWRCTQCSYQTWGYWVQGMTIRSFVARSDLPEPLKSVFTVGTYPRIRLAVTATRWRELVGQRGTRGFVSSLLGVLPDEEVVRHPRLPTYEEQLNQNIGRRQR